MRTQIFVRRHDRFIRMVFRDGQLLRVPALARVAISADAHRAVACLNALGEAAPCRERQSGARVTARRNEVALFVGDTLCIPLSPARACRVAHFELRTGVKIEDAILTFLDDELFNIAPAIPAPAREQSTSRE